ncbi:Tm-1-like ATP-binding domain-containing protein [Actinopolymorpha alba]|uniref:Tm-1-like ATP-binding domain-containing protein n=1 Tax=Actinopolymorpha alba TaxID=533267 RepID=UPI000372DBDB|nr:Tm-1-like ATP-binding domain-containing protein [Actinopolymorpha alba]
MATVVLLGTLDTKGAEYSFVCDRLVEAGLDVVVVDAGIFQHPNTAADVLAADITAVEVAAAAGVDLAGLAAARDRGAAVTAMARGAAEVLKRLHQQGSCAGALALGGTGGTSIAAQAFRELPLGVPKVIVSTAASGDTRAYVAESDLVLFPSVTDVAGVNRLSARILANAAAALAGMVTTAEPSRVEDRPLLAASMFGVTTPCVSAARELLEKCGYEVLVFHMTGVGGRTLERLAAAGWLAGVLDVTTTELADELVGGVFSAGPDRLTAAGRAGVPQVVSVGALDMVNFGPKDTVPDRFAERKLYVHNPSVTLMRTTPQECAELGTRLATRLNASTGPAALFLPLRGISAIAGEGGPFHDAAADEALYDAVRSTLDRSRVELVELDLDVNDPAFAASMVDKLDAFITAGVAGKGTVAGDAGNGGD